MHHKHLVLRSPYNMYNCAHREREKASHLRFCEPAKRNAHPVVRCSYWTQKKTGDHPELWQSPGGAQLHPPILDDLPNFSEMGEKDAKIAHLKNIKDLMLVYFDRVQIWSPESSHQKSHWCAACSQQLKDRQSRQQQIVPKNHGCSRRHGAQSSRRVGGLSWWTWLMMWIDYDYELWNIMISQLS